MSLTKIRSSVLFQRPQGLIQDKLFSHSTDVLCKRKEPKCGACAKKPKKKRSFFSFFEKYEKKRFEIFNLKKQAECKAEHDADCDPDLSALGDDDHVFRTEGTSHIVVKDKPPIIELQPSREELLLKRIEANLEEKNLPHISLPPFVSVEQRMMELDKRKLHPLYKKFMRMPPKKITKLITTEPRYTFRGKSLNIEDIPIQFEYNKGILNRKNIYVNFKRVHLSRSLLNRIVELQTTQSATLENAKKYWTDYQFSKKFVQPSDTLYHQKANKM
ncbi:uncharacterized protein LOC108737934 [Agrilus planipennis]|uniref:Uncharacterized protein LOC108737934 n=1 Tax=Agrilus planipennis TaxID=224129 RepID=A0A1W4X2J8_AGRPL|nr:uncharacterized protein LOC108737934 [Agrilus planipennis]